MTYLRFLLTVVGGIARWNGIWMIWGAHLVVRLVAEAAAHTAAKSQHRVLALGRWA